MKKNWFEILFAPIALILGLVLLVLVVMPLTSIFLTISALTSLVWAAIASLSGIGIGLRNVAQTAYNGHRKAISRPRSRRNTARFTFVSRFYEPQPAALIYMADAGWYVIEHVFRQIWKVTRRDARSWFDKGQAYIQIARQAGRAVWHRLGWIWLHAAAGGMYAGGVFHYVATFLIVTGAVALLAVALVFGGIASALLLLVIGALNHVHSLLYRITVRCPNCHEQMKIPVIICPRCNRKHTRLWPSIYGVFSHTCFCGERLPTLDILGRRHLTQRCPHCDELLNEAIGRSTNIHIPIVGGPSAGKTHYIVATTRELIEAYGPAHNIAVSLPDPAHRRDYEANIALLNRGQQLSKTMVERSSNTRAYNLQVNRRWHHVPTLLYIYDGAGEYYTKQESALQQVYYRYINGIILIIDPFTIERVYQQYRARLLTHGQTLAVNVDERLAGIYERMLETLEIHFNFKRGVRFPHPIAVVLTKVDAFDLEARLGAPAIQQEIEKSEGKLSEVEALNAIVQRFLYRNGEGNFVRNLNAQFRTVRYFTCSSTGRMVNPTNHSRFKPVRVLDPLLWLMAENRVLSGD